MVRCACLSASVLLLLGGLQLAAGTFELTSNEFNTEVASGKSVFVDFYTPWCSHCKVKLKSTRIQ
jgi:thiol-disulfide isomerase/thioredoxin